MPLLADRYEMGPLIGQGGMAEVYAATDTRLDRPVAIKVMRAEVAHQQLVRERFEAEARMAARLVHPNVVSVFDSGEQDGIPYIVMELLPGQTLRDRMRSGPMTEAEVRAMALEVLAALDMAHGSGILHRDIKPGNILAAEGGHWKVADFGIAKALEVDQGDATATGLVLGTPAYLAPERFLGAPATVASDLYSLGVVLYEALGGRRPYDTSSAEAWPAVLAGTPPVPLTDLRADLDPGLARAVTRTLARDPGDRFASAAEMSTALGGEPGRSTPGAAPTVVMAPAAATEVMSTGADPTALYGPGDVPPGRRTPWAAILGGVAAAAVIAGIVIALIAAHDSNGGSPSTTTVTSPAPSVTTTPATTVAPTTAPPATTVAPTTTPPPTTAPPTTTPAPTTTTPPPTTTAPTVTVPTTVTTPGATAAIQGNGNGTG